MKALKNIELVVDYSESMQYIEQQETVDFDNGYSALVNIFAEVIISTDTPISFYDERQSNVSIEDVQIEIIEAYNEYDEPMELGETTEKELKKEIKSAIY